MLSRLHYGAFLPFDPRGSGELARRSQTITYQLKQDAAVGGEGLTLSRLVALRMREFVPGSPLEGYLDPEAVVVPMPRAGLMDAGALWPGLRIAEALVGEGFGSSVVRFVTRARPVHRSSTAPGSRRLWPDQHYDSMSVERTLGDEPPSILLVDDVITRGATLLGAACRLAEVFPDAQLRGFAVCRTVKEDEAVERIPDPRVGQIQWRPGWIERTP